MSCVFFHIDLDAFFASVELLDHPEWRNLPLIIGSKEKRSVCSTCSYEARKYGVHSAMPMATALRLCPDALVVKPRMSRYVEKSREVMDIIKSYAPSFLQVSVDEAFLDMSGMEKIHGLPGKAAKKLKEEIRQKTGLTASLGVASSRYIAKLASDYHKPDGMTIVPPGKEMEFVDRVGLEKLWGIGSKTLEALKEKGIRNVRDIREKDIAYLERNFGKASASFLYSASHGIDPGIYKDEAKSHSISTESTYWPDIVGKENLKPFLLRMSEELMMRAIDEGVVPRQVGLKIRYSDFSTYSIQETPEEGIYSSGDVYKIALKLLDRKLENRGVRLIGLQLKELYKAKDPEQLELFKDKSEKERKLEKTILDLSKKGLDVKRLSSIDDKKMPEEN